MKRFGMSIGIRPELVDEYKRHHRRVWPEVEQGLAMAGIRQMTIFLLGDRLFMYAVTDDDFDWATSLAEYERDPRCNEWQRLMETYQQPLSEARAGEWWALMEEVYHLDA